MPNTRILILGGSGFVGQNLYKELQGYFDCYATYNQSVTYRDNQRYLSYRVETDDLIQLVESVKPTHVICSLRGPIAELSSALLELIAYQKEQESFKFLFLSSANVFDAYTKYPSYEMDKTLSESKPGRYQILIENALMRLPKELWVLARVPMIFGNHSPRIEQLKYLLGRQEPIEVFPNLCLNVTFADQLVRQIHFIINRRRKGIFHLGSTDLCLHEDLIRRLIDRLGNHHPILKRVYTTNDIRYSALISRENKLPKYLQFDVDDLINHHLSLY